ncbi:YlbF family regulator [Aerococcus agrisoli]|uniref:YlbF family regulator n=1 Tax=Aerococcus agrisoli TaxID=2487350 RepID=UPI001F2EC496|nr:YlbF family regulator [Aerococcus agrisoli]
MNILANIYDTINQLERDIRDQDTYKDLVAAIEALKNDEEAYGIYNEFRALQTSFQLKAQMGQEITEEDEKNANELQEKLAGNAVISDLMNKERLLNTVVEDINQAVTRPINEIYQSLMNKEQN